MIESSRRTWLLFAVFIVIAVGGISIVTYPRPRLYQGKSVHDWVTLLDPDVSKSKERDEASRALAQIGAKALPELEQILAWRRHRLTETIQGYAIRFGVVKPPAISHFQLQSRACEAAFHLAERANVDIGGLIPHLRYHFTNGTYADWSSGRALAGAGASGVAVLTNLLLTGTRNVRDNAGASLRHANRKPEVIAALVHSAEAEFDPMLRANALLYLRGSRGPAEQLVPLGLKFLQSMDAYDRRMATTLLRDYASDENVRKALEEARAKTNVANPQK